MEILKNTHEQELRPLFHEKSSKLRNDSVLVDTSSRCIVNLSEQVLWESQTWVLSEDLKFALTVSTCPTLLAQ